MQERHHLLPQSINPDVLAEWLKNNARDTFKDEQKIFFTDDDISNKARQSSGAGAEIIGLKDIVKKVTEFCTKGLSGQEPVVIEIYPTNGTKALEEQRKELDIEVKKGYILEKREIYGIPDSETAEMVYFDVSGNCIEERTRKLSVREIQEYIGLMAPLIKERDNLSQAM